MKDDQDNREKSYSVGNYLTRDRYDATVAQVKQVGDRWVLIGAVEDDRGILFRMIWNINGYSNISSGFDLMERIE